MLRSGEHPGESVIETRGREWSLEEAGDCSAEALGWRRDPVCAELLGCPGLQIVSDRFRD